MWHQNVTVITSQVTVHWLYFKQQSNLLEVKISQKPVAPLELVGNNYQLDSWSYSMLGECILRMQSLETASEHGRHVLEYQPCLFSDSHTCLASRFSI